MPERPVEDLLSDLHRLLELEGGALSALARLREYGVTYSDDPYYRGNRGGILIDIGTDLRDRSLVQEGIDSIKVCLSTLSPAEPLQPLLEYNLANGYCSLHCIDRHSEGFQFDPDSTHVRDAVHHYRAALDGPCGFFDANLLAQIWTNFGNALSSLGRSVEAIAAYDKALACAPDHPMALGNLGVGLERFASIAQRAHVLREAKEFLDRALASQDLERLGGPRSRVYFTSVRSRIMSWLGPEETLRQEAKSVPKAGPARTPSWFREYAEFCRKHQLFLNFCLRCRRCEQHLRDTVLLSLTTSLEDTTTFPRLARVMNEAKERYATARFLLFSSISPATEPLPIDEMTAYVDNLDYAVYGVRVGQLKLAFESAYNILDKIAFFINEYLSLGIKPKQVYFTSIWVVKDNLREELCTLDNYHLFALYDISRDLQKGGHLEHLRDIRQFSTHRYLVPHVERISWIVEADGEAYHIDWHQLVDKTIQLLKLVRSAVIYLIAFSDQEERKEKEEFQGVIGPLFVPTYDPSLYTFL